MNPQGNVQINARGTARLAGGCIGGVFVTVTLSLLGPFHGTHDGQPIAIGVSKARALLAYLALEADRPHSRAHLATLFWPDHPPAAATTNLRQALTRIRRAFPEPVASDVVVATGSTLQFGVDPEIVDAVRFQRLLADERAADPRSSMGYALRQEAIDLYRGELLAGFLLDESQPFEEWLRIQRERFRGIMLDALRVQTMHHRLAHEFTTMLRAATRQVEMEPWRESGHRDVMTALTLGGDRAAAIAHYHACARLLAEELGVEPDAQTRGLFEDIVGDRLVHATPDETVLDARPERPPRHARHSGRGGSGTPLVGRERERADIFSALFEEGDRLLTVTGPGGVGKTRLSLEVSEAARDLTPDGVWVVPLAAVHNPDHVAYAVADALDIQASGHSALVDRLGDALSNLRALLVLDNFEQVIEAAAFVGTLLERAPNLRVLVTSREALRIGGERVYRLSPLALPEGEAPTHDEIVAADAVRLFASRVRVADPGFAVTPANSAVIGAICQRLEGLPLTLEMAAARLAIMSPEALLERLDRQLPVLKDGPRDAPRRHQTMRVTLAWSHDLLSDEDQRLFRRLAVFPGGFTLDSVEALLAVLGPLLSPDDDLSAVSGVASLVAKSLVVREEGAGDRRFRLLEVVREYAAEKLDESGEARACWSAHADILIERFGHRRITPFVPDDLEWDAALEAEHVNIGRVFDNLLRFGEDVRHARLAGIAGWHWFIHGRIAEAGEFLRLARRQRDQLAPGTAHGLAVLQGIVELSRGGTEEARSLLTRELQAARERGDSLTAAQAQVPLGVEAIMRGAYAESLAYHQAAAGDTDAIADPVLRVAVGSAVRATMGSIAREVGNLDLARECTLRAIEGYREVGGIRGEMLALVNMGDILLDRGEIAPAMVWYRRGLALAHQHAEKRALIAVLQAIGRGAASMPAWESVGPTILGAEERLRRRYGVSAKLPRPSQTGETVEERLRSRLGGAAFDDAWDAGRRLTLDQVVELAYSVTDS